MFKKPAQLGRSERRGAVPGTRCAGGLLLFLAMRESNG